MDDFEEFEEYDGDNGNLLEEDDTLDYILYNEMEKNSSKRQYQANTGCSVLLLVLGGMVPAVTWGAIQIFRTVF